MRWNEWQETSKWQKKRDPLQHCFTFLVPSCNFIWQFGSSFDSRNIIYWNYIKPNFKYLNIQRGVRASYLNEHWTILAMVQMPQPFLELQSESPRDTQTTNFLTRCRKRQRPAAMVLCGDRSFLDVGWQSQVRGEMGLWVPSHQDFQDAEQSWEGMTVAVRRTRPSWM